MAEFFTPCRRVRCILKNEDLALLPHGELAALYVQRAAQIHTSGHIHRAAGLGDRGLGGALQRLGHRHPLLKTGNAHDQVAIFVHTQIAAADVQVVRGQDALTINLNGRAGQVQRAIFAIGADKRRIV